MTDEQGRYSIGLHSTRPLGERLTITATFSGMSPVTHTLAVGTGPLAQDFTLSADFQEVVVVGSRASGGRRRHS